jgi:hypothetical protein
VSKISVENIWLTTELVLPSGWMDGWMDGVKTFLRDWLMQFNNRLNKMF